MTEASSSGKSRGGVARAQSLSAEARAEIARRAATARWSSDVPVAEFEGEVSIAGRVIPAAVLPGGRRVLSQSQFLQALGRSERPAAGTGGSTLEANELPSFLRAEALKGFVDDELREATVPILYRTKTGRRAVGYDATLLPKVCEVYLRYRDSVISDGKKVLQPFSRLVKACDLLMRGFAEVGIVALVDEATGYQEVRDRAALQAILDKYLTAERAKWAKTFPDDFYRRLFRVRGKSFDPTSVKRPGFIGHDTNNLVYDRLAPGVLQKLREVNPTKEAGRRKHHHHQFFTRDYGVPELKQHILNVMFLMDAAGQDNWKGFQLMLDRAAPRKGSTLQLPFDDE
jgi:P63C domain